MRSILKKLKKGKAGFSLAETLIAILILLMVSAIVAGAMPAAASAYQKTVDAANAQILLSTAMTVLRDELATATDISVVNTTKIEYKSGNTGNKSKIESNIEETGIGIQISSYPYMTKNDDNEDVEVYRNVRQIVSEKAATKGMVLSCTFSKGSSGEIVVTDLTVKKDEKELAKRSSFTIRPIKKA